MFGRILFWLSKSETDLTLKLIVIAICTIVLGLTVMHFLGV